MSENAAPATTSAPTTNGGGTATATATAGSGANGGGGTTTTGSGSDQNATNRGLPYYEKLRRELRDALQKKRMMDKNMVSCAFSAASSASSPARVYEKDTNSTCIAHTIATGSTSQNNMFNSHSSHYTLPSLFQLTTLTNVSVTTGPTRGPNLPLRAVLPRRDHRWQHHQGLRQLHQGRRLRRLGPGRRRRPGLPHRRRRSGRRRWCWRRGRAAEGPGQRSG